MKKNKKAAKKVHEENKKHPKISNRINAKAAKRIRKQVEFIPSEPREYTQHKNKHNPNSGIVIKCKYGSPRELYKYVKRNKKARSS